MPGTRLNDYLDAPVGLVFLPRADADSCRRRDIESFQLAAAQRKLLRQAGRIPALDRMLNGRDPAAFERLEDFVSVLFDDDIYKSYDPAWIENGAFDRLTGWIDCLTTHDLSGVHMDGCASLTQWCRRIDEQAGIFVCHSSGTSGVLSFVPRSQRDRDLVVDGLVWTNRPLFDPQRRNDVTYFTMNPRWQYRITQALYDGLERRYLVDPVQALPVFSSPEFAIAQGNLRKAAASGTTDACLKNPIVAACRVDLEQYQRALPGLIARWTQNLMDNFRGRRIYFQGSFEKAWQITREFDKAGITGAFAPESVFALFGGVKDGSQLPGDWQHQFRRAMGVEAANLTSGWGMSELVTGAASRCPGGMYHFAIHSIPFLLDPGTRAALPRTGVQTGQLAILQLVAEDCWEGVVSGDRATVHWDRVCSCGRDGPLMDPDSIGRM